MYKRLRYRRRLKKSIARDMMLDRRIVRVGRPRFSVEEMHPMVTHASLLQDRDFLRARKGALENATAAGLYSLAQPIQIDFFNRVTFKERSQMKRCRDG